MLRGSGGCWRPPVPGRRAPALLAAATSSQRPCLLQSSVPWASVGSELASEGDLEAAEAKRIGVKGGGGAVKGRRDLKAGRALGPRVAAPGSGGKPRPDPPLRLQCPAPGATADYYVEAECPLARSPAQRAVRLFARKLFAFLRRTSK
ncbi:rCG58526 [Rattus norvegicus]|uniref:RIKEN cDNA 9030612E09 gene like n=2 Tax=Rattus norvegicus TaxID=10116 RepID=D3Z996_RAT|nr:uncharacterized protein LOC688390 [Rattus norvegicus]EDL99693.1 rCG58526 [Rattus norvegicus]|eukprot:NP_001102966.1 uncharacterized protein LOC688390 [Rattus norvegicus]